MSFVDGFYSFRIDLTDSSREVYEHVKFKTPKHPYESIEHLLARVLALTHSYEDELVFSEGFYDTKQASIWKKDVLGEIHTWIQVGVPDIKKLKLALKIKDCRVKIYFYDVDQIHSFTLLLKGSTTNWIESIDFYLIDQKLLIDLAKKIESSNDWHINIMEEYIAIHFDDQDLLSKIEQLNIWDQYQKTIFNY